MELIYKSRIEAIAKRETNYNPIIENRIVDEARQNGPLLFIEHQYSFLIHILMQRLSSLLSFSFVQWVWMSMLIGWMKQ